MQRKLQYVFEHAKVGIAMCNASKRHLEMINPAYKQICGYDNSDLIDQNCKEHCILYLLKNNLGESICNAYETPFETKFTKKDGEIVPLEISTSLINDTDNKTKYRIINIVDISKRKNAEQMIDSLTHHDVLTSLPNRALAEKQMEQTILNARQNSTMAAMLFIDLDEFKTINDTLGHFVGDTVLKSVADRLRESIKKSDMLYRLGGDEFLLVISNLKDKNNIKKVIKRIYNALETPIHISEYSFTCTASIGIALCPKHGDTFETLFRKADIAMFEAKKNGKNGYCFYDEQINHYLIGHLKILNDLKQALQKGQFVLYYQPQVDIETNAIIGVEALLRWKHPMWGLIPPMHFIPIAEENGLIVSIGKWVIREACRQAAIWHKRALKISVAINVSALQFKRGNLKEVIANALQESDLPARFLEVELTESILMNDTKKILSEVHALKALGLQLSIDDFGTGFSSLSYLKQFIVDKLKIDKSFVLGMLQNQEDRVITQTIIQMAKNLNLKTIAEGVESAEVSQVLKEYGCDEAQGFYFAKPMSSLAFEDFCGAKSQKYG